MQSETAMIELTEQQVDARESTEVRGPLLESSSVGSLRRARISWDREFHAETQGGTQRRREEEDFTRSRGGAERSNSSQGSGLPASSGFLRALRVFASPRATIFGSSVFSASLRTSASLREIRSRSRGLRLRRVRVSEEWSMSRRYTVGDGELVLNIEEAEEGGFI
jgi:hypothetical protein